VIERMTTPQIRGIMQRVAVLLRPAQPRNFHGEAPLQILELAPDVPDAPVPVAAARGAAPKSAAPVSTLHWLHLAPATLRYRLPHPSIAHRPLFCLPKRSMTFWNSNSRRMRQRRFGVLKRNVCRP